MDVLITWNMFQVTYGENVNKYADSVTRLIKKCIDVYVAGPFLITDYKKKASQVADTKAAHTTRAKHLFPHASRLSCRGESPEDYMLVKRRKAASPNGIPNRTLRAHADQLAVVFSDIFNLSNSGRYPHLLQDVHHHPYAQEKESN